MKIGKVIACIIPLALLSLAAYAFFTPHNKVTAPPVASRAPHSKLMPYWGVSVPNPLASHLKTISSIAGVEPGIIAYYTRFGSPLQDVPIDEIEKDGAVPLIQWNPTHTTLTSISNGRYDDYIRSFAATVRGFRAKIIISFAHEANGPWWPWGKGNQSAESFVNAWRHIHDIFTETKTSNVIWLWNPNVKSGPAVDDFKAWWPGTRYVTWIGLDGYYWKPTDTFTSVFSNALQEVRKMAPGKPVIIAETGAYPGVQMAARIKDLFNSANAAGLTAVVYFDHSGHSDWRIEQNEAAGIAFRTAIHTQVRS